MFVDEVDDIAKCRIILSFLIVLCLPTTSNFDVDPSLASGCTTSRDSRFSQHRFQMED